MAEPTRVIFRKLENGKKYESAGYYRDRKDFEDRNPTLYFDSMTKKTKPIPKKKEV